jgi:hypothetical protein
LALPAAESVFDDTDIDTGLDQLPDDPGRLVVCKRHVRAYQVGELDEARDAFDRVKGPLDTPWQRAAE